jgi:hypothetical protein
MPTLTSAAWLTCVLTLQSVEPVPDVRFESRSDSVVRQLVHAQAPAPPVAPTPAPASAANRAETPGKEFFVSWGYNGDSYTRSNIHISQPSLGSDFTFEDVQIRDSKGWTDGLFAHSLTVPQYNVRFGVFFNDRWGLELAFDHFKWIVKEDQQVRMTGTVENAPVDTQITLTPDVLRYQLNNGANPLFINVIRRIRLAGEPGRTGHLAFLAKAGAGFAIPHTENTLFGRPNEKGFQFFQGWNVDAVAAARIHLWKPLYFEFEEKLVYARYFGVNVDQGKAGHSVKASEFTFSFGWLFR